METLLTDYELVIFRSPKLYMLASSNLVYMSSMITRYAFMRLNPDVKYISLWFPWKHDFGSGNDDVILSGAGLLKRYMQASSSLVYMSNMIPRCAFSGIRPWYEFHFFFCDFHGNEDAILSGTDLLNVSFIKLGTHVHYDPYMCLLGLH